MRKQIEEVLQGMLKSIATINAITSFESNTFNDALLNELKSVETDLDDISETLKFSDLYLK